MSNNPFEYLSDAKKVKADKEKEEGKIQRQEADRLKRELELDAKRAKRNAAWQKYSEFVIPLLQQLSDVQYFGRKVTGDIEHSLWSIEATDEHTTYGEDRDNIGEVYMSYTIRTYVTVQLAFDEDDVPIRFAIRRDPDPTKRWDTSKEGPVANANAEAELTYQDLLAALKTLYPPVS